MKIVSINKNQTQTQIDQFSILQRAAAPTPKFFQKLKVIGITLATVSAALIATPGLPVIVATIAGYLGVAATVATAVSQVAVDGNAAAS